MVGSAFDRLQSFPCGCSRELGYHWPKKIPHRLGMGLKIPSLRWIREGQTLPAGDAEATIEV
jgi:hypothetical protein